MCRYIIKIIYLEKPKLCIIWNGGSSWEALEFHLSLLITIHFLLSRPTANLDEPRGRHMPPDSWRPSSPRSMAPNQYNNFGSDNPLMLSGGAVTSADTVCFKSILCCGFTFIVSSFRNIFFSSKHDRLLFDVRCSTEMVPYQLRQLHQLHRIWYN